MTSGFATAMTTLPCSKTAVGVADEHFGFQRFQNVAVRRFGFCNHGAVLIFHVGRGNVVDGDDAV